MRRLALAATTALALVLTYACGTDGTDVPPADGDAGALAPDGATDLPDGAQPMPDSSVPTNADAALGDAGPDAPVDAGADTGPAGPLDPAFVHYDINHVLTTGQSNSIASGARPPLTTTQPYSNRMFNVGVMTGCGRPSVACAAGGCNGSGCTDYQTPTSFVPLVEGDTFFGGAYVVETTSSGLANEITRIARAKYLVGQPPSKSSHDVLVSLHGRSGLTYWCLRKGGCTYLPAYNKPFAEGMRQITDAKALAAAAGLSYVVRGVTVIHGESDHYDDGDLLTEFPLAATSGVGNINHYGEGLIEWQKDYQEGAKAITGQTIPVPLFISQMNGWTDTPGSRLAVRQVIAHENAPGRVILIGPTYQLPFQTDCLHYTNHSSRRLGEYFAKAYASTVLGGKPWQPVRPMSVTRAGAVITVTFNVPVPPLVIDTTRVLDPGKYGFTYHDESGAPPAITTVALAGPDTVRVTLASAPVGPGRKLRYALNAAVPNACPGPTQGARGNLRDSDTTPSEYGYDLHNWSVAFEKDVP